MSRSDLVGGGQLGFEPTCLLVWAFRPYYSYSLYSAPPDLSLVLHPWPGHRANPCHVTTNTPAVVTFVLPVACHSLLFFPGIFNLLGSSPTF